MTNVRAQAAGLAGLLALVGACGSENHTQLRPELDASIDGVGGAMGTGGGHGGDKGSGGDTGTGGATQGSGGATGSGGGGRGGTPGTGGKGTGGTGTGGIGIGGTPGTGGKGAGGAGTGGTIVTSGPAYPLKLAPGQRYLVDQNGVPFLLIGDSPWDLFDTLTTADATTYLEDRRVRGFNAVLVEMSDPKFTPNPPANAAGDLPFTGVLAGTTTPDFSTPNEAYFAHVDQIINIAAQKGILVELTPAYLGYAGGAEGWYQQMVANGTTRLAAYGTYVGNRYRGFANILWVEGGDTDPSVTGIDARYPRAIAAAIKAADPNHLHTVHGNAGSSVLDVWAGETWIDVSTVYTYPLVVNHVTVGVKALAEYARAGAKPFFLIESTYDSDRTYKPAPQTVRQQAYEALLSGAMGQNYGNDPIWYFGSGWQSALNSQGANDITRLRNLFAARHWERLVPDAAHAFLTAGFGSGLSAVSAALSSDGKLGIFYLPGTATVTVNMTKLTGAVTARWFDPTSGALTTVPGPLSASSQTFSPSGKNAAGDADWILLLEAP